MPSAAVFPHPFENSIWIFLLILSCLVVPRLEELHSCCRQGKLDTSVRAVLAVVAGLFSKTADVGRRCVNQPVLQEEHLIEALSSACRADLRAVAEPQLGWERASSFHR